MIECIADLLKYDPEIRLTSRQCLEHRYILETIPGNIPPGPQVPPQIDTSFLTVVKPSPSMTSVSPRPMPSSHSNVPAHVKPAFNGNSHAHRKPFFPTDQNGTVPRQMAASPDPLDSLQLQNDGSLSSHYSTVSSSVHTGANHISEIYTNGTTHVQNGDPEAMEVTPPSPPGNVQQQQQQNHSSDPQPMDISSPSTTEPNKRLPASDQQFSPPVIQSSPSGSRLKLFSKKSSMWGRAMFGNGDKVQHNTLPPVDELNVASTSSTPSLNQSSTAESKSLSELSPGVNGVIEPIVVEPPPVDAKTRKKEAERVALEAEKARRAMAEKRSRDQARAVMQKRSQLIKQKNGEFEWEAASPAHFATLHKSKQRSGMPQASSSSATINAAGGRFRGSNEATNGSEYDNYREAEHRTKARRRDMDDDHSMSSSDLQSVGRLSVMSFATVESDPLSQRLRHRPSLFGIHRMQSSSSLRTSFGDDYSLSARSSNSPSYEQQLASDFDSRASMSSYEAARSSMSEASSPLPMHSLSLSSPQQQQQILGRQQYITLPVPVSAAQHSPFRAPTPSSPYEYGQYGQIQAQPPSPAIAPHSAINPIFKVVSFN